MLKPIQTLLKDNSLFIASGITLFIAYLSLSNVGEGTNIISNSDKYGHVIAYFFLGYFWLLAIKKAKEKITVMLLVAISCIIYGIIIEALQGGLTSYRTASFKDALANTIGVVVALILFTKFHKKVKLFKG